VSAIDVGAFEDFTEALSFVTAAGREIVVFKWADQMFAMRNRCPHQNLPFLGGRVECRVEPGPRIGDVVLKPDEPVLVCPVHGWEYDRHGRCTAAGEANRLRLKSYPVEVRHGRVLVSVGSG
jgi:3-phenylpropionate/trans-cinnamate dioxygenase ferredoxin subunit